ncbi:hypothetical protein LXM60_08785 [Pandoraea sputorum]|nr:hypothetical protein [Pandoraea sputorum]MCE4060296.1 hypothetical protein [Pandoraea sputorum]
MPRWVSRVDSDVAGGEDEGEADDEDGWGGVSDAGGTFGGMSVTGP